ncbi:MAG: GAF domain-containing protein [Coleofasciculaceae cyanobacterium RL_1_1]|nr:GAF domain-containing protein [Coleofasciculaceae cyanobacterium RL_1_1]
MTDRLDTQTHALDELLDSSELFDLTNCDREPIHRPGFIQPHGLLLVLSDPDLYIRQVSSNAQKIVAIAPQDLLGHPLSNFINADTIAAIHGCLDRSFEHINPLPLTFTGGQDTSQPFNGIVHRAPSGEIVLELEPSFATEQHDFFQFHRQVKDTLLALQTTRNLDELCSLIVNNVQRLTGFDRVMVYQFNHQGDGHVIAETITPDLNLESFLGLRYPATDIPRQARYLYTQNWLRLIPDFGYQASELLSELPAGGTATPEKSANFTNSAPRSPLDMSRSVLRSVSPLHIEYMQNMGVTASMSISLLQNGKLWGLIACHHYSPKFVPYDQRTVCEFLGQLMSTEITNKEANDNLDYQLRLKDIQHQFIDRLAGATDFIAALVAEPDLLLTLTGAAGVILCDGDDRIAIGQTPDETTVTAILRWLPNQFERDIFVTQSLPSLLSDVIIDPQVASGLLAMAISTIQNRYVLWFRPEVLQTVTWAGKPEKNEHIEADGTKTLRPRTSFAAWQETVQGTSIPWWPCEINGAIELRQAIIDIVLRQADALTHINQDLQRSNTELDAFAYIASHDLKEPLRGIHNYATFLLEDYGDILAADGTDKLHTLVRLTERMELLIESLLKFSRLGRQDLQVEPIDLNAMLRETITMFRMNPDWEGCEIRILPNLPIVWGDRSLIDEVLTNLISNGFKYNSQPQKWVEVGYCPQDFAENRPTENRPTENRPTENNTKPDDSPPDDYVTLYVRDNGIGIRDKHIDSIFRIFKRLHAPGKYGGGSGAGLTIVRKIVERHGGTIHVESLYGQGTTFFVTLPVRDQTPLTS